MRRVVLSGVGLSTLVAQLLLAESGSPLVGPTDLKYLGAFRLDEQWAPEYSTWENSNAPLAYFPDGDPTGSADGFPGSLFIAGHVYASKVAELAIPAPVKSRTLDGLPTARVLQRLTDVTAGIGHKNGFIMGMAYIPSQSRIFFTHGQDYSDADCDQAGSPPGLGSFTPSLSAPDTRGLWFLGGLHPFTSLRYIMEIPPPFAAALKGREIATGRHRGWCPEGTNLYASAPWQSGSPAPDARLPYSTLMQFGDFTDTAHWSKQHASSNAYQGGVWLTAGSKAAVVISGIIDFDPARAYYGYDNWKFPSQCDPNPAANGCSGNRGWRAADPHAALLFYNPAEVIAVANGAKAPSSPQWYARLDITPYLLRTYPPTMLTTGADAEDALLTFDRARGLLYVSESFADGNRPVVHVFSVASDGLTTMPPAAPSNVRIIK
jgi:hypothetical protein